MNLVDSLNNTAQEQYQQLRINIETNSTTYDWDTTSIPSIISNNPSTGILSDSISISRAQVDLSDETINTIAERVYNLIRQRGIE